MQGTALPCSASGRPASALRPIGSLTTVRRRPCSRMQRKIRAGLPAAAAVSEAEVQKAFKRLQNGSDIRGVALASKPDELLTFTPAAAFFIAAAFVDFLREKGVAKPKIAIGCDPRVSGPLLVPAALAGLAAAGATAVDVGLSTTPAMFYGIIAPGSDIDGSIMTTASHMPMQNNGLKFFTAEGGLDKSDITALLDKAANQCLAAGVALGDAMSDPGYVLGQAVRSAAVPERLQLLAKYAEHLAEVIKQGIKHPENYDKPLTGLKIIVDAGNGSGGFFATEVLQPLGADISGSQFLEPDGTFPNHIPNPENKAAMAAAVEAVKRSGADLGIIFDTDVDRSAIVDGDGTPINSNKFIALMAAIVLQEHPGSTVVTDSVTSNGLTAFIEARGGKHFRFKRGYKNVISKGVEINKEGGNCELMMETSGHGAMRSNHYLDDGSHLALTAIVALVQSKLQSGAAGGLGELLSDLQEPAEAAEYRITIRDPTFQDVGAQVLQSFHTWVEQGAGATQAWSLEPVNYEGWRVNIDEGEGRKGWLLLRQSLHDPLLVLNIESDTSGGASVVRTRVKEFLSSTSQAGKLALDVLTS